MQPLHPVWWDPPTSQVAPACFPGKILNSKPEAAGSQLISDNDGDDLMAIEVTDTKDVHLHS